MKQEMMEIADEFEGMVKAHKAMGELDEAKKYLLAVGALRMAAAPDRWQPIETAPKDRVVLLYGKQVGGSKNDLVKLSGHFVASGYWDGIDTSWCVTGSTWHGPFVRPTHWMPLPEAPQSL